MTHIGANTQPFIQVLTKNPDIELFRSPDSWMYSDYDSFNYLSVQNHKAAHAAAIYMDEICHNFKFQRNMILPNCEFIFYLDEPRASINRIAKEYGEKEGIRYYTYRLQGLYEYMVRTKGIIATWKNWNLEAIVSKLNLRKPLIGEIENSIIEESVSYEITLKAERVYEDLLFKTKSFHEVCKIPN